MSKSDEKIWPIRIDYRVRTNIQIILSPNNTLIEVDAKLGLKRDTVFDHIRQIAPATIGTIVDYDDRAIAVRFPSGLDWSTFVIWINRGAAATFITGIGPPE